MDGEGGVKRFVMDGGGRRGSCKSCSDPNVWSWAKVGFGLVVLVGVILGLVTASTSGADEAGVIGRVFKS